MPARNPRPVDALTFTIPEAADALGLSPDTVRTMVAAGDIPTLRIGRRLLISRTALARWVDNPEGHQVPSRPSRPSRSEGPRRRPC